MVGASKILTVSYGTFSCTLEGFDEPFSTMKAIAEYFRDLAADDRYFGAVPPTPDAEMLHKIAEREIHRRVEARVSEHGIVLRPEGAAIAAPQPAPAMPVSPPMAEAPAPVRPAIPDSVAAKLARIRAVVSEAPAAAAAAPVATIVSEAASVPFEEDEETEEFGAPAATDFGFDLDIGDMPGLKAVMAEAEEPAEVETVAEAAAPEDLVAELTEDSFDAAAETLEEVEAEDDLRALDGAVEDDAEWEAEHAAEAREALTAEEFEPEELLAEEPEVEELLAEEEVVAAEDWSAEKAEEVEAAAEAELPVIEDVAEEAPAPSARVIRIGRTDEDFADEDEDEDEFDDETFDMSEDLPVEDRTAAVMAALSGDDYDDEDFEDDEAHETDEAEDNDILAQIGAAIGDTGLPAADEEDLLSDLAEITRDARRDSHEGRAILESASEDDEASVERLMEEAKSKLEGPENRRRFSAIAHLKAAVAATVADRKLKTGGDAGVSAREASADDTEAYREDLSKAVRPRRPTSDSVPATQRPTLQTRMAPLVLVSEQRVDLTEEARSGGTVVRPRRVSTAVLETKIEEAPEEEEVVPLSPEDVRSFAEFAEQLGATSLSDLLEAAAAYTANVEGATHFSRPQILRRIEGLTEDEDYSREDGLRSFGMLLRQGKIQKVRRGQFILTDASRFKNEARRIAQ